MCVYRERLATKKQKNNGLSGRAVSDWTVLKQDPNHFRNGFAFAHIPLY